MVNSFVKLTRGKQDLHNSVAIISRPSQITHAASQANLIAVLGNYILYRYTLLQPISKQYNIAISYCSPALAHSRAMLHDYHYIIYKHYKLNDIYKGRTITEHFLHVHLKGNMCTLSNYDAH